MISAKQREAIRRHSAGDLLWLLIPGRGWRNRILTADQPELGALRGRLRVGLVIGSAAIAAAVWVSGRGDLDGKSAAPQPAVVERTEPEAGSTPIARAVPEDPRPTAGPEEPAPVDPVDERTLAEKRTQMALFSDAKVTAVYAGHDVRGVRIENVGPGSFWDELGVRSGDVVIEHDGTPVDTPAAMVALLNAMESDLSVRLVVTGADGDERTVYFSAPR